MQIVRERPCQRQHHRVTAPMMVTFPGRDPIQATDWSLGGVRLDGLEAPLPQVGARLTLTMELPFQGFDISFEVDVEIVRTDDGEGTVAAKYVELSERANDLMMHFIDDLVRGKMATIEDTICRIDVPVTPISTKPDPNPKKEVPVRRWPIKTIVMSTFYLVLGVSVFSYLSLLLFTYTMRIEVKSAMVSAPLTTVKMPVDGTLVPVRMEIGAEFNAGEEIARIENTKLQSELDDKKIEVTKARRALLRVQERYRIEAARLKLYQVINKTDRDIATARVMSSREALAAIDRQVERLSGLLEKRLIEKGKFETAVKQRAENEARLKEAEALLERSIAMEAVSGRRYFNHKEFVSDLDVMGLEVEEARTRLETAQMLLEKLERDRAKQVIRSPFAGRVVEVHKFGQTDALRNEPLLTLQKRETPTVIAFIDQDQVLRIGLEDEAVVFVPSLGRQFVGQVAKIDRNSAFLRQDGTRYGWRDGLDKSASISLTLSRENAADPEISAGLPVTVLFSRRSTSSAYNYVVETLEAIFGNGRSKQDYRVAGDLDA